MRKQADVRKMEQIRINGEQLLHLNYDFPESLGFIVIDIPEIRRIFDDACDEIHYAKSCQRVGRCMRLAIVHEGDWVGGIVLGSTFPNIKPRDEAFGLSKFIMGWKERGLISPWARENKDYWDRLQLIVNHARTFVFPKFQGHGLGIAAHTLLLTEGKRLWEERYGSPIFGFDTLCTHPGSRLFKDNGWELIGQTRGYSRVPSKVFSKRAFDEEWKNISDNAGLRKLEGNMQWWIWVKVLKRFDEN